MIELGNEGGWEGQRSLPVPWRGPASSQGSGGAESGVAPCVLSGGVIEGGPLGTGLHSPPATKGVI